ncbi:UNVERIFIED_CONTAM: hypothetical protein FOS11_36885, partial [Bacillus thuringiensis]
PMAALRFAHGHFDSRLPAPPAQPATSDAGDVVDVWALMASPNPARFTTLTSAGGSITVDTCPNAYTNPNGRLPAQLTRSPRAAPASRAGPHRAAARPAR